MVTAWWSHQCALAGKAHHLAFVRARTLCMSPGTDPLACLASSSSRSDLGGLRQPNPNLYVWWRNPTCSCFPVSLVNLCWVVPRGCLLSEQRLMQLHLCQMGGQNAQSGHLNAQITFLCKKFFEVGLFPTWPCLYTHKSFLLVWAGSALKLSKFPSSVWHGGELASWLRVYVCNGGALLFECSFYVSK